MVSQEPVVVQNLLLESTVAKTAPTSSVNNNDYIIADLSLAAWGRKELTIAQTEMTGLMAIREEYAP